MVYLYRSCLRMGRRKKIRSDDIITKTRERTNRLLSERRRRRCMLLASSAVRCCHSNCSFPVLLLLVVDTTVRKSTRTERATAANAGSGRSSNCSEIKPRLLAQDKLPDLSFNGTYVGLPQLLPYYNYKFYNSKPRRCRSRFWWVTMMKVQHVS